MNRRFVDIVSTFGLYLCLFLVIDLYGHGFGKYTLVKLAKKGYQSIECICKNAGRKKSRIEVLSYDLFFNMYVNRTVKSAGMSVANCYFEMGFDPIKSFADIMCTPDQEFYVPSLQSWLPVYQLKEGDDLLTKDNGLKQVTYLRFIKKPLEVFTIEVESEHNFFVGSYSVLTHNIILPISVFASLSVPFGSAAGASLGSFLGPITAVGGLICGGICGVMVNILRNDKMPSYRLASYNTDYIENYSNLFSHNENDSAQAPGAPSEEDGYEAPKNYDGRRVKNPNGSGTGWVDRRGNVWVPTGPKGHG